MTQGSKTHRPYALMDQNRVLRGMVARMGS
jgi:hypothetical protein